MLAYGHCMHIPLLMPPTVDNNVILCLAGGIATLMYAGLTFKTGGTVILCE